MKGVCLRTIIKLRIEAKISRIASTDTQIAYALNTLRLGCLWLDVKKVGVDTYVNDMFSVVNISIFYY